MSVGDVLDHAAGLPEIGCVRDLDVEQRPGPELGHVADALDGAVRYMPERALDVTDLGRAERDPLDDTACRPGVDDVAEAVLVLDEHEHPRDQVTYEVLRTEADGNARDADAGEQRSDGDTQLPEDHDRRDAPDERAGRAPQEGTDGLGSLSTPRRRGRRCPMESTTPAASSCTAKHQSGAARPPEATRVAHARFFCARCSFTQVTISVSPARSCWPPRRPHPPAPPPARSPPARGRSRRTGRARETAAGPPHARCQVELRPAGHPSPSPTLSAG